MFLHVSVIHSVHRGEYLTRYPPGADPPRPGTPPKDQVHPRDQVHPPGTRYTPLEQTTPPDQVPPRSRACWEIRSTCGRSASYWNAILFSAEFQTYRISFSLLPRGIGADSTLPCMSLCTTCVNDTFGCQHLSLKNKALRLYYFAFDLDGSPGYWVSMYLLVQMCSLLVHVKCHTPATYGPRAKDVRYKYAQIFSTQTKRAIKLQENPYQSINYLTSSIPIK